MLHEFRNRNLLSLAAVVALAITAAACQPTTTLEQGWTTPHANQPRMTKVVTVFSSDSVALRRSGEDQLARQLAARGVVATPGYAVMSDAEAHVLASNIGKQNPRELEPITSRLREMGYDGVVTMQIVDREQNLEYAPGTYYGGWGYPGYWGYWDSAYYWPGYAYTEMTYRLETNAYSLRNNQLVWAGLVRSIDPNNARELIDETSHVVAGELTKRGLAG